MKAGILDLEATSGAASTHAVVAPSDLSEAQWTALCEQRLVELRPRAGRYMLHAVALDLAQSLSYFDPVMAAEMEHEGGMLDD